jgi:hypothetical protein
MSSSTAIGMVSSSLRALLVGELQLGINLDVTVLAPDEAGGDRRVNLFLYRVQENTFLRNAEPRVRPGVPGELVPPPLALELYYLVTCYAPKDPQTGNVTAHQMLGETMRVFHQHPVLPREYLDPGLLDAAEELRIVGKTLDPEELSRIWTTFDQPFRLSVLYQVATVLIDARTEAPTRVPRRVREVGVPDVRARAGRPVVSALAAASGPAGSALTFRGEHLAGWRARVDIGGATVLDGVELVDDTITATVPSDLAPGLYDVRVDVARLFRRTFLFEVTP